MKMNLRFIKKLGDNSDSWSPIVQYIFYLVYEDDEDLILFGEEFELNCKNQIG